MKKAPFILAASAAAASAAVVVIAGRRLTAALGSPEPGELPDRHLHQQSRALVRHLEQNPRDVFAAELLQDIDLELIRRAA